MKLHKSSIRVLAYLGVGICLVCLASGLSLNRLFAQIETACERSVTVQPGDTLSGIANEYLGSFGVYQSIIDATNAAAAADDSYATIENASLISIGWKLCLPGTEQGLSLVPSSPTNTARSSTAAQSDQSEPTSSALTTTVQSTTTQSTIGQSTGPQVSVFEPTDPTKLVVAAPTPPPLDQFEELHPLMIEAMRQQSYPGSELVIEQTLDPGANYSRYVASYQSDGNKIFGLLTIPADTMPAAGWPVILFNHGYIPPEIYRTTERYVAYQDAFARSGYISFKSDYRGHGSSEGAIDIEGNRGGNRHAAYTIDVLNAMAALKLRPDVDANRIGMWGHSMGGQITLRAMVISGEIKAGSIWAGTVANYTTMWDRWQERSLSNPEWANRTRRWREELVEQYGPPAENPAFWASISPNSYLADLSGPILLQHATGDHSVPVAYSDTLSAEIKAVGGNVNYYRYEGDDHNLASNLRTALIRDIAFFDMHLK